MSENVDSFKGAAEEELDTTYGIPKSLVAAAKRYGHKHGLPQVPVYHREGGGAIWHREPHHDEQCVMVNTQ